MALLRNTRSRSSKRRELRRFWAKTLSQLYLGNGENIFAYAFRFGTDVGTIESLWEAHRKFLDPTMH